jgi:hypothetical protein
MVGVGLSAEHWLTGYRHWLTELAAAGCPPPTAHSGTFHVKSAATCSALKNQYPGGLQASFSATYRFAIPVFLYGVPVALALIGALVGAPLVAREVEQRTHLTAWTQSVSRRRWYATKVAVLAAGLAIVGVAAGYTNAWLQRALTDGGLTGSRWSWFLSINLAAASEALLTFALAVALGAWLRRTLPAVAGALAGTLALVLIGGWMVRSLTPATHVANPRFGLPANSWIIQIQAGRAVTYHPASQYWSLQLAFLGIMLAVTAATLASGWHATRTRAV